MGKGHKEADPKRYAKSFVALSSGLCGARRYLF